MIYSLTKESGEIRKAETASRERGASLMKTNSGGREGRPLAVLQRFLKNPNDLIESTLKSTGKRKRKEATERRVLGLEGRSTSSSTRTKESIP